MSKSDGLKSRRSVKADKSSFLASIDKKQATAIKTLKELDNSSRLNRVSGYEFYLYGMHSVLGYDDNLQGCMQCFKNYLKFASPATMYRYISVGETEAHLGLEIGSQALTVMIKLAKFNPTDQELIWKKMNVRRPSMDVLERTIKRLLKSEMIDVPSGVLPKEKSVDELKQKALETLRQIQDEDALYDVLQDLEGIIEEME